MKKKLGIIALIISIIWIMYLGFVYNKTYFEHYPKVTVTVAERKPFIQDISTVGYVEPAIKSTVRSAVSGKVLGIMVNVGDYVRKGTSLFQIESPDLELQIQQAKLNIERLKIEEEKLKSEVYDISQYEINLKKEEENLKRARQELEKAEFLFKNGIITLSEYNNYKNLFTQTKLAYELAEKSYKNIKKQYETQEKLKINNLLVLRESIKNAEAQLKNLEDQRLVKAGIDGRIVSIFVKKGEYITAGTPIILMADERKLAVSCVIDPKYIDKVKTGQEIRFKIDPLSTKEYKAQVDSISEGTEELMGKTGIKVTGRIRDNVPGIKVNMPVYMRVLVRSRELSVVVPVASIHQETPQGEENPLYYLSPPSPEETEYYVFVLEGTPITTDDRELRRLIRDNVQVVRKRKVEIGGVSEDEAEIISGLKQFEKVVTYSSRPLNDYDRVIVIEREKWAKD
ncbi:MAG: HlyD family efflux transporter periplasmic adaptor subunit [bacterium]|nr:HlyD family efflux transporter periplasmic adaptor subunit [bacterium]